MSEDPEPPEPELEWAKVSKGAGVAKGLAKVGPCSLTPGLHR